MLRVAREAQEAQEAAARGGCRGYCCRWLLLHKDVANEVTMRMLLPSVKVILVKSIDLVLDKGDLTNNKHLATC